MTAAVPLIPFRRCPRPAAEPLSARYGWPPGKPLAWYLDPSTLPANWSYFTASQAVAAGFAFWPGTCNITLRETVLISPPPDVTVRFLDEADFIADCQAAGFDPTNVLALTDMPDGTTPVLMRLRLVAPWTVDLLTDCVHHEAGHAIGLSHTPEGTPDVMEPYLDPSAPAVGPYSGPAAVRLYGPASVPAPTPPAPSDPPEPAGTSWTFVVAADGPVEIPELGPGTYQITLVGP